MWVREHGSIAGAVAAVAVVLGLYARTLTFGFFGDDPSGYFRWMEGATWGDLFTSSPGFFLRPMVFVVSKLILTLTGGYVAPAFHAVPLLLHLANTLLVGVLAGALTRRPVFGWIAALLFATFPLSHEAVAEYDAIPHPLVTFWTLLALVLYERGRRTGHRVYLWAAAPAVVAALLSHENGLVAPVLLLSLEVLFYPPASVRDLLRRPVWLYFALPLLYMLWWLQIPKSTTAAPHTLAAVLRNTLPFLQAAVYPLLPLARLSVTQWPLLLGLVALTLVVTGMASRTLGLLRVWLLGVVWIVLASVPSILFLDWDYVHGGPRLYYLASAGAALLWAAPPLAVAGLGKGSSGRRFLSGFAAAALVIALILPPLPFIRCQLSLFDQATRLVRQVATQAAKAPAGRNLVFVNLPVFITSNLEYPSGCAPTYPFVTTGVGVYLPYVDVRDFNRVNGGPDRPAADRPAVGRVMSDYAPNWPPRYGDVLPLEAIRDTLAENQVYVFEIGSWSLRDLSALWQPAATAAGVSLATFADVLALENVAVTQNGSSLEVALEWRVQNPSSQPLTAFVHVYDKEGRLLAQHDGPPGRNDAPADYIPLALWQTGDRIRDVHTIPLAGPLPEDGYTIAAGLYDPSTVIRLPAVSPAGERLADDLYRWMSFSWSK